MPETWVVVVRALLKGWRYPVAGALICAVIAGSFAFFRSDVYETEATMVLQTSLVKDAIGDVGDFIPRPMDVMDYIILLESNSVLAQLSSAMRQYGKSEREFSVGNLKNMLQAEAKNTGRDSTGSTRYSKVVELTAVARTPELAARLANQWALVGQEAAMASTSRVKAASFELVEQEYTTALANLEKAEDALLEIENSNGLKLTQIGVETRGLTTTLKTSNAEALNKLADEWQERVSELKTQVSQSLKERELYEKEASLGTLEKKMAELRIVTAESTTRLETMEQLEKSISPVVVTRKAIENDPLWEATLNGDTADPAKVAKTLEGLKLFTEEINPVYTALEQSILDVRVNLKAAPLEEKQLVETGKEIKSEHAAIQEVLQKGLFSLDEADRQSKLEVANLALKQDTGEKQLEDERKNLLDEATRIGELEIARAKRDVENQKKTFDTLAEKFLSAKFAVADRSSEIVQVGVASTPMRPLRKNTMAVALAAFVVGVLLGAGYVLFKEIVAPMLGGGGGAEAAKA